MNLDNITPEAEFTVQNTTNLQTESLINYAAGIGYEPVYDAQERLRSFRAPQFDKSGEGRVSVNTMIDLHNFGPRQALREIHTYPSFKALMNSKRHDANRLLAMAFAGTLKLVEEVKGQGSRKEGLIIQSGMVKFVNAGVYFKHRRELGIN